MHRELNDAVQTHFTSAVSGTDLELFKSTHVAQLRHAILRLMSAMLRLCKTLILYKCIRSIWIIHLLNEEMSMQWLP